MVTPLTFAAPHAFLGARPNDRDAAFCVAGVPMDIGTTNRAGSRDGPRAIRAAARMLTDGRHPDSGAVFALRVEVPGLPVNRYED